MKPAVTRFLITVVLFLGWLGFLTYQVKTLPMTPENRPLVLSRPQILTSEVDILAELPAPDKAVALDGSTKVVVEKVLSGEGVHEGQEITVLNLHDAQPRAAHGSSTTPPGDAWTGAGRYLIPLKREGKDFLVAPVPPSPGYWADGPPRVYPATEEALAQYHTIPKPLAP